MTKRSHQEKIARCLAAILALDEETVQAFFKGNPADKLIRSYTEFSADGVPLYRREACKKHYRASIAAINSGLPVKELYGEHVIPISCSIKKILSSNRSEATVLRLLRENEVVLLTKDEARHLDRSRANGGLGLKSSLPAEGGCRLQAAGIEIAPETLGNTL